MIYVKDPSFIDAVSSEFSDSIRLTEGPAEYLIADPDDIPILISLEL